MMVRVRENREVFVRRGPVAWEGKGKGRDGRACGDLGVGLG